MRVDIYPGGIVQKCQHVTNSTADIQNFPFQMPCDLRVEAVFTVEPAFPTAPCEIGEVTFGACHQSTNRIRF